VAALSGAGSIPAKVVDTLIGVSAVYQAASLKAIQRRWNVRTALREPDKRGMVEG